MNRIKAVYHRTYIFPKETDDKQDVVVLGSPTRQDTGLENAVQKQFLSLDREVKKELSHWRGNI